MDKSAIRIRRILAVGLLLVSSWASACFAQNAPDGSGKEEGRERRKEHRKDIVQELNLTQEQQDRLAESRKQNQAARKETFAALKETRGRLWQELGKANPDQKEVDRLSAEVKALQARALDNQVRSITSIRSILMPEQYEKFQNRVKEKRGMRKEAKHAGKMQRPCKGDK